MPSEEFGLNLSSTFSGHYYFLIVQTKPHQILLLKYALKA